MTVHRVPCRLGPKHRLREEAMRRHALILSAVLAFLFGAAALAGGAEPGPETNKLKVKVGPFFVKESDKKIDLQGPGPQAVRKGKRINITVTVENYGKSPIRISGRGGSRKPSACWRRSKVSGRGTWPS